MEAKRVARAGVMTALLAVSAQVMLPLGPVPFTLQTLVLAMVPAVLDPATSVFTVLAYVVLGAVGLPVFAGFNGGKTQPLVLGGTTTDTPAEADVTATIDNWNTITGDPVEAM